MGAGDDRPGILGVDLESPAGYAFHTGQIVISNHLQEETRFRTPKLLSEHGIKRAIKVLIARGGECTMASIRYHRGKYQARVRRQDRRPLTKTFTLRKDALEWARLMEVKADRRDLPEDTKVLQTITLGDLVRRYRDEVRIRTRTSTELRSRV